MSASESAPLKNSVVCSQETRWTKLAICHFLDMNWSYDQIFWLVKCESTAPFARPKGASDGRSVLRDLNLKKIRDCSR